MFYCRNILLRCKNQFFKLRRQAAAEAGSAAARRYRDKMTKSFQACNAEGIKFFPVVVETLGEWHGIGIAIFEECIPLVSISLPFCNNQEI